MGKPRSDLTGRKFGMLTVKGVSKIRKSNSLCWDCTCDCGKDTVVVTNYLNSGHTRSCGCLRIASVKTHGLHNHKLGKEEEAALAYNEKAKELHGEYAYLNKVEGL